MRRILSIAAVVAVSTAGVALAASAIKGARYSGTIHRASNVTYGISFKVSSNGRSVSGFVLSNGYPAYCQGGGFPHLGKSPSGKISKHGTFSVKWQLLELGNNKPTGSSVIITGKFAAHGKEAGKVETKLTATICNGSSSYSTTG
jgi:hypothetical protein